MLSRSINYLNCLIACTFLILFFSSALEITANAQTKDEKFYVGVSYYPKIAGDKIDWDIRKMEKIGVNQVRFGEFDWISMEPGDGKYDFGWLENAVDKFAKAGIAVQLCTPTGTPPIWLETEHPDIHPVNALGLVVGHGGRRQYSPNSPVYRKYAARIVEKLGQKFGKNPGIISWQIDNEFWGDDYSENSLIAFHKWLKQRYGTIDNLNNLWCNDLWSQEYQSFDQIPLPDQYKVAAGIHPSLLLAYRRFMSDSYISFCDEQVNILRKYTNVPITTNGHNPLYQEIDYEKLFKDLDAVCFDSYAGSDELYRYAFEADWMRSLGKPFWLAETAVGFSAGTSVSPKNDYDNAPNALRAKMWLTYALGGKMVSFWLWRQHWAGQEMEHSALIYPWGDEYPNTPVIHKVASELKKYSHWLSVTKPKQADVALYYEIPMQWIFEATPIVQGFQYDKAINTYYKIIADAGTNRDVIMASAPLKNYKVIFSPFMPAFEKGQLNRLEDFVEKGGTWVLGPLSACRTLEATAHQKACYGLNFEKWLGIHVRYRLPVSGKTRITAGNDTMNCGYWCDAYEVGNKVKIIAKYSGGPLNGMAAIVECKIGKGRVIVMGTEPDELWLKNFIKKITPNKDYSVKPGVFVIERTNQDNKPAGIIAINTTSNKTNYRYHGVQHNFLTCIF